MRQMFKLLILACVALLVSACSTYPSGWSQSCSMPFGSYESEHGVYSMTLVGDETDSCHRGTGLGKRKQRSELKHSIEFDQVYEFAYEFKYSGAGGATILQLHPGKAPSNTTGFYFECNQLSMMAGFNKVRLNVPGRVEFLGISDDGYKDKWHKVVFRFRASKTDPLYQMEFNQELVFNSEDSDSPIDLCYYNTKPNLKIGLYRGKRETTESISYRNLKLNKLD